MKHNLFWLHFLWQNEVQLLMSLQYKVSFISGNKGCKFMNSSFYYHQQPFPLLPKYVEMIMGPFFLLIALGRVGELEINSFIIVSQWSHTLRAHRGWPQSLDVGHFCGLDRYFNFQSCRLQSLPQSPNLCFRVNKKCFSLHSLSHAFL